MAHDLTPRCGVLSDPQQLLDLQSALPMYSMEASGPSPSLPSQAEARVDHSSQCKPVLHVEVCQHAHSSMRGSKLKDMVLKLLAERGTAFSQLIIAEFDDPILKEHLVSVAITDTPAELTVRYLTAWHVDICIVHVLAPRFAVPPSQHPCVQTL